MLNKYDLWISLWGQVIWELLKFPFISSTSLFTYRTHLWLPHTQPNKGCKRMRFARLISLRLGGPAYPPINLEYRLKRNNNRAPRHIQQLNCSCELLAAATGSIADMSRSPFATARSAISFIYLNFVTGLAKFGSCEEQCARMAQCTQGSEAYIVIY